MTLNDINTLLVEVSTLTTIFCVIVLPPLTLMKRTRGFSAGGLYLASFLFGASLWLYAMLITYDMWGGIGVVVGLLTLGVPTATIASVIQGNWWNVANLVYGLVLTFGTRILAIYLFKKLEVTPQNPKEVFAPKPRLGGDFASVEFGLNRSYRSYPIQKLPSSSPKDTISYSVAEFWIWLASLILAALVASFVIVSVIVMVATR